MDLWQRLADSFSAHRERACLREGARAFTYGEVEALAGRLAARLADLGLARGERLLAQTDKSAEALLLYLAAVRLGAVYVPVNPDYTEAELDHFFADAEPALAVCGEERLATCQRLGAGRATVRTLAELFAGLPSDPLPPAPPDPEALAAIVYTSGTTGKPKGAMLRRRNLVANGDTLVAAWGFTADDRLLHALPLYHVHGLFVAVHCALFSGASLTFLPRFEAGAVLEALPGASVFMGVPTYYTRLLERPDFTREAASGVRLFVSGSAPLSPETFRAFAARTGTRVLERYGMSETGMLTSNPLAGERKAGSVGPPLPGVELRIADPETGQPLPPGEVGVVEVRGPNVFTGYWRQPEKTAAEFRSDGFFVTGDLGYLDADGYLWLVGRARDLVISGGLNVYPAEVEAALDALPGVLESAVIGVPHPDLGEGVVAVIRADASFTEEAARAALKERLAGYKVPKAFVRVEALPRNAMGKVQKNMLREQFRDLFAP